ncbi:hypothetical protein [Cysteiniphilum sp. SYW-8]|uniref:hypothetical protein n=1 Tax=Cysteiniphilum sp. SYW-8 TaxID=2610890 RepID=UPI00123E0504|nr:hypothetical protein [Cysteiniphilum sp. SYW-8]
MKFIHFVITSILCIAFCYGDSLNNLIKEFNEKNDVEINRIHVFDYVDATNLDKKQLDLFTSFNEWMYITNKNARDNIIKVIVYETPYKNEKNWSSVNINQNLFISGWSLSDDDFNNMNKIATKMEEKGILKIIKDQNPSKHKDLMLKIEYSEKQIKNATTIGQSIFQSRLHKSVRPEALNLKSLSDLYPKANISNEDKNTFLKAKENFLVFFSLFGEKDAYKTLRIKNYFQQTPLAYCENEDKLIINSNNVVDMSFSHTEQALLSYIFLNEKNISDYNKTCPHSAVLYIYSRLPPCQHCSPSLSFFTTEENQNILKKKIFNRPCPETRFSIVYKSKYVPQYLRYESYENI